MATFINCSNNHSASSLEASGFNDSTLLLVIRIVVIRISIIYLLIGSIKHLPVHTSIVLLLLIRIKLKQQDTKEIKLYIHTDI